MEKIIKVGKQFRNFTLVREDINVEKRTVALSFSSETPVERYFGLEILDHSKDAVDLTRLKRGGALLIDHNPTNQIGVIEEVLIDQADRKGRAIVRFGKSARAEEIFRDVVEEIRKNVSVGYMVHGMKLEKEDKETGDTYRVTRWEPLEISLVSIPADVSVGVGRAEQEREFRVFIPEEKPKEERKMDPKIDEIKPVDIQAIQSEARKKEQERVAEILAIGKAHKCEDISHKAITENRSLEEFKTDVLKTRYKAVPVDTSPDIGMTKEDIKQYSIVRAIRNIAEFKPLDGLEKEASDAVAKIARREAKGFFIPQDVMKRALSAGDATKGGFLIGTDVMAADMIELLRNKTLVASLGARVMGGLVGNVAIPRVTGGAVSFWLNESGAVTATDQAFGQLGLVPHRLVGDTAYAKELVMQSSPDVEAFVREDLMRVLAIAKDMAAINGLGANGEPLGILGTTGIGSVTFGAAATWAKVIDFETAVANANADIGNMAYLTSPAVRGKWKSSPKVSGYPSFLWDNAAQPGSGMVNGYRAEATKQVPSDKVIFGNWQDLILADWSGVDVVIDPYSLKKTGQIEVTVTIWTDCGVRHAGSFCVSSDSGAQ